VVLYDVKIKFLRRSMPKCRAISCSFRIVDVILVEASRRWLIASVITFGRDRMLNQESKFLNQGK